MRINSLIGFLFFCSILFSSCDDDLRSVGGNIQPGGDNILLELDSLGVNARTVLMNESVAIRNTSGLVGRYEDDTYGSILSEYLTEFYCPDDLSFADNVSSIDSTRAEIQFLTYHGDSLAPMGVSLYQLNNELEENYYTSVDVSKYCDLSKPFGSKAYTIKSTPYVSTSTKVRKLSVSMGNWGKKLYDASQTSNNPLKDNNTFRSYFPGIYVKSSFGNGSLFEVGLTDIVVYYTTQKDTVVVDATTKANKDSVMYTSRSLYLTSTTEVIQLNKVENKVPQSILTQNTGAIYIKSPAGVCAELELPIKEIIDKTTTESANKTISMARLRLKGYTELEQKNPFDLGRASTLLLINKDSVQGFFNNPYRVADLSSSLIYATSRDASTNSYVFSNLAPMISEYRKKNLTTNPKFVLIPVTPKTVTVSSSTSVLGYFNSMKPAVSIIRAGEGDIKLELIYSTF